MEQADDNPGQLWASFNNIVGRWTSTNSPTQTSWTATDCMHVFPI